MKSLCSASLTAVLVVAAALSAAGEDAPVNSGCPVMKGKPAKASITSTYEGKTVGFCCNKCKAAFDQNPKQYVKNMPEFKPDPNGPAVEIGKKVPVWGGKDTEGKPVGPADFKGKIIVLEWLDPKGEASGRVASGGLVTKMVAALKGIKDDVVVLELTSSDGVDGKAFVKFLADSKIEAKGVMDTDGRLAKGFGVKSTPTCFVIDAEGVLRYSGAPDDDADGKKADKATNYVVAAVKAIVDGKKVETETTKPYGEDIKFKK